MATLNAQRIREPAEASGTIGVRAGANKYAKYGATRSSISEWVKAGDVLVARPAAFPGDTVLLDEASLRRRIAMHSPHRDNASRKPQRSRTIPEERLDAQAQRVAGANGHAPATGALTAPAHTLRQPVASRPKPVSASISGAKLYAVPVGTLAGALPEGVKPQLETAPWLKAYYGAKLKRLAPKTQENYDLVFDRFKKTFLTIPLDRRVALDYIEKLKDKHTLGPMSDSGKGLHLQTIITFYKWLRREYGYNTPDLTGANLVDKRGNALTIYPHEIRATLKQVRNRTEADLVIVVAQTGIRIGELCTIRPEFVHDHWMELWGKPTRVNKTGYRQVPVPDEAYRRLLIHWKYNRELVWQDSYGINHPLAGPVERADPESRRAINLEEPRSLASAPKTFRVQPASGAEGLVKYWVHQRLVEAGVYEPGKGMHSFRRAYTDEALKNAEGVDGAKLMIDRILGHFDKKDMSSLYHHTTIERLVAWAERYAPRAFLGEAGEQGKLSLVKED